MKRAFLAEVTCTFALVFAGTGAIVINDVSGGAITHAGIAFTFGLIVMAMIYAVGDISGAHLNPAVTVALCAARRFPAAKALPYIAAQTLGALAASGLLKVMFQDHPTLGATLPSGSWQQSFLLEVVLTAILMFVVLTATTGSKEKVALAGLVIGGVVALEAMFAGPICGASMNPARSFAPAVVSGKIDSLWIYMVATTAGALLAVPLAASMQTDDLAAD